jgi:hypothetical protein
MASTRRAPRLGEVPPKQGEVPPKQGEVPSKAVGGEKTPASTRRGGTSVEPNMHTTGSPVLNWELGPVEDGGLMGARVPLTSGETIQLGRTCTCSAKDSNEQVRRVEKSAVEK